MKKVGLIGGMSWHSTVDYYRVLNERVARAHGDHASARVVLESMDFAEIRDCQLREDWDRAAALLTDAALRCQSAGADVVAICTNLMHKVAPSVEAALDVPLLHIADAVAREAIARDYSTLGVLGTSWVMEERFYADRLAAHGLRTVVPDAPARALADRVIFEELTQGRLEERSRASYVAIVEDLAAQGADAVVLACTEIGLLLRPDDSPLPLVDSLHAHAGALAEVALDGRAAGHTGTLSLSV